MGNKISIKELASEFLSGNTQDVSDIVTFCEQPWGIRFPLFPVQKFILKCTYGMRLDDTKKAIKVPNDTNDAILFEMTEVEFLNWLYENKMCNTRTVEGKRFNELIFVSGRRSGKSQISSCIAAYELYKLIKRGDPSGHYGFPLDSSIDMTIVAPTDDQAGIAFDMAMSKVFNCSYLQSRCVNQTLTYFNIQTDSDINNKLRKKHASLSVLTGGCSSNSLRGRNNILIVLDEMAFFIDNSGRFSGAEIYKALKPSTGSFKGDGKVICISSPYAKYGSFYERYTESFNEQDTTLMFQMYTSLVNPAIDSAFLKTERRKNKISFGCEYGGQFSDSITAWIDDEERFKSCVNIGRSKPSRGEVGVDYFMGVDLGLKNDGTAIGICHKEPKTNKIIVDYSDVWFSGSSDIWEVETSPYKGCNRFAHHDIIPVMEVASTIKDLCRWFPIKSGWFDQYNGYALHEIMMSIGMKQFHMEQVTDTLNSGIYQLVKTLYIDGMIEFYNDELLIKEMLSLEAEKKSRNQVKVRAPNKRGSHDDLSDAVVRAVWECYQNAQERGQNIIQGQGSYLGQSFVSMQSFKMDRARKHGLNASRAAPGLSRRYR
jgi:phage terminase large subunit-like protein